MDLVELVSPHVAVPVIGVVLCAFMVFAFGFRSSVQPPSFDFEEKKNKRRLKQTKLKGNVSGDAITAELSSEAGPKSTPKPTKEVRPASSPKAKVKEPKLEAKKELKQDVKGEKKVKAKKEGVKDDSTADNVKKVKRVSAKKEAEEDGEWTTIQVSKKGKKQKPTNKREGGRAESAVESENEPEIPPVSEAAAASSVQASDVDEPSSPEVRRERVKNKTKLGKGAEKNKTEEKTKPPVVPAITTPVPAVSVLPQTEEQVDSKKKKNKREKKISGDAAASALDSLPQDAAPASGRVAKKELSPAPASEGAVKKELSSAPASVKISKKEINPAPASSEGAAKKDLHSAPAPEKVGKKDSSPVKKEPSPAPAPEKVVKKELSTVKKDSSSVPDSNQNVANAEPVKPSLKKKKNVTKETIQEVTAEKAADIQIRPLEKSAEAVKKSENKLTDTTSKAVRENPRLPTAPESELQQTSSGATGQPTTGISFDEIGDSWQEATPKSKKKKPRREN